MKRQEMQGAVWDDHDVWRAGFSDERRHQPLIKLPKPGPGGLENLLGMNRHIFASHREMVELKSQTRSGLEDVAYGTKPANDFCIGSRDNERQDFISGHEILDQSR